MDNNLVYEYTEDDLVNSWKDLLNRPLIGIENTLKKSTKNVINIAENASEAVNMFNLLYPTFDPEDNTDGIPMFFWRKDTQNFMVYNGIKWINVAEEAETINIDDIVTELRPFEIDIDTNNWESEIKALKIGGMVFIQGNLTNINYDKVAFRVIDKYKASMDTFAIGFNEVTETPVLIKMSKNTCTIETNYDSGDVIRFCGLNWVCQNV